MWLTGLRETVEQLPAFVRVAHAAGVGEVYLQRLVFFGDEAIGMARPDQALFERLTRERPVTWRRRSASPPRSAWPSAPPAPRASPGPA
jgi:hypothetical protein